MLSIIRPMWVRWQVIETLTALILLLGLATTDMSSIFVKLGARALIWARTALDIAISLRNGPSELIVAGIGIIMALSA